MKRAQLMSTTYLLAALGLLAVGCVAQVGTDTTEPSGSVSPTFQLPKPVEHNQPSDSTGGGDSPPATPTPAPQPTSPAPTNPSPGDINEEPVPSPWYGGSSAPTK